LLSFRPVNGFMCAQDFDEPPCKYVFHLDHNRMRVFQAITVLGLVFLSGFAKAQDVQTLINKADALDAQDRTLDAIAVLKEAEKISPNNPQVLIKLSKDYSDAIEIASEQSQKSAYAALSLEYAKRAVHEAPNNSDAHSCLSIAYGKITDFVDNKTKMEYSKVIKSEAEKAVELNPNNAFALLVLARWNFDMATLNPFLKVIAETLYGHLPPASKEKAVEYFQRAIAAAPDRIILHAEYARALDAMGRTPEAKAEWLKVTQLKPSDADDRRYVAEAEKKLR
jgi:tetratricopeptide (TPR) repeat protein